ncbi:MAG: nucleoside recognition domain-containing protein, partial [Candidatus ainarchaeum sp.]|nr:nucleoside recognition domain-containing protein [Candidatus ainarchaeum sp.]
SLYMHNVLGYFFLALILLLFFYSIFSFGGFLSGILEEYLYFIYLILHFEDPILSFFSNSVLEGIIAGLVIAIPYLIPFYILLAVLEDSGYLSRIAYLTDGFMHRIGLHGKAFIPIVLGYGCSVPACIGCRIMENRKQQFTTAFLVTLIPCAARSIIIFSLVAAFLGAEIALLIYVFNLVVVLILGFIASFFIKGETPAMIMNMPSYKLPDFPSIFSRTFFRIRNFIFIAFPIIILSTLLINFMDYFNLLHYISDFLSPITVDILGLPAILGITLIVGILRKELIVLLLASLLGTSDFGSILTPIQIIVFTIVSVFYIPCAATIATLYKEFGLKKTFYITIFDIVFAILLGFVIKIILSSFFF